MDEKPAADWPRRVYAALELADVRGDNANVDQGGRGYDRIAGLGKLLDVKHNSQATMRRHLRKTDWEAYELEAWLKRVADVTGLPYAFFTAPDLQAVIHNALVPTPAATEGDQKVATNVQRAADANHPRGHR